MISSVRELERQMKARISEREIERDGKGRAVIQMTVLNDDDFLSDFSSGDRPVISSEVAEFLEQSAMAFSPKEGLTLKVYSDCIDAEEQVVYRAALKEYYTVQYKRNARDRKRNLYFAAAMMVIGVIGLVMTLLCSHLWNNPILAEILDIFAWVFLWECADILFLQGGHLRLEKQRYLRLFDAKLELYPKTNSNQVLCVT